jgi:hypothetical protein
VRTMGDRILSLRCPGTRGVKRRVSRRAPRRIAGPRAAAAAAVPVLNSAEGSSDVASSMTSDVALLNGRAVVWPAGVGVSALLDWSCQLGG